MSVLPKTRLPMRIIALPLTSAVRGPGHTVEPSPLVYYHFQMPPKTETRRGGWADWATGKAASIWAQFGKAPESSWKVRVCGLASDYRIKGRGLIVGLLIPFANQFKFFTYGERLVDRVDFEELALKGVDPSMGPKISRPRSPSKEQKNTTLVRLTAGRRATASEHLVRTRFRSSIPELLEPRHWLTSKRSLRDERRGIARDSSRGCYWHR